MDSIDQSDFFLGKSEKSAREGFPIWCADRLTAVKWRNWKLHFFRQDTMFDPPVKLGIPFIINLYTDPREENPTADTWVVTPMLKMVGAFNATTKDNPLIPMGTPDPYTPPKRNNRTQLGKPHALKTCSPPRSLARWHSPPPSREPPTRCARGTTARPNNPSSPSSRR